MEPTDIPLTAGQSQYDGATRDESEIIVPVRDNLQNGSMLIDHENLLAEIITQSKKNREGYPLSTSLSSYISNWLLYAIYIYELGIESALN